MYDIFISKECERDSTNPFFPAHLRLQPERTGWRRGATKFSNRVILDTIFVGSDGTKVAHSKGVLNHYQ